MSLKEEGFRFMYIGDGEYEWIHETRIEDEFIDCTDMTDDEFDNFVFAEQEKINNRFRGI